jgi:PAS domain S-box-containing protein
MESDKKFNYLREKAEKLLNLQDKSRSEHVMSEIEKLTEEINIQQIELEMQNKELQATNIKLEEERRKYRELYMNAPAPYFTLNTTGNILNLNYAASDLLQMPIVQFKYTSIFPYLEESSKFSFTRFLKNICQSGNTDHTKLTFVNSRQEYIYTNLTAKSYFDPQLNETLVRLSINEQEHIMKYERKAELDQLAENTFKRYEAIFSSTGAGIALVSTEGIILECNPALENMLEYEPGELCGKSAKMLTHPDDYGKNYQSTISIPEGQKNKRIEKRYITKNGKIIWGDLNISAVYENNEISFYTALVIDISTRKTIEKELLKNKERFKAVTDNSFDIINIIDQEGTILYESKAVLRILGYKQNQRIGKSIFEYIYPDDIQSVKKAIKTVAEKPNAISTGEYRIKHADGSWRKIEASGQNLISNPDIKGIVINSRDISQRRKAELDLSESRELLDLFFYESREGFFFMMMDEPITWNKDTDKAKTLDYVFENQKITKINDAMLAQYAAKREDFLGLTPNELFEHDIEQGKRTWTKMFDTGRLSIDTTEKRFDGTDVIITGNYICLYDSKGRITGHFGVQQDVTRQRLAKQALKESEQKYRLLTENMLDLVALHEPDGTYTFLSPSVQEMLGYRPEELVGTNPYDLIHPEDKERIRESSHKEALKDKDVESVKFRIKSKIGEYRWFETKTKPIKDNKNKIIQLQTISSDITRLKETQDALTRFRTAIDNSSEQVFLLKQDNLQFIDVNQTACKELKYSKKELLNMRACDIKPNYTEEQLKAEIQKLTEEDNKGATISTVHETKNGENIPVEVRLRKFNLSGNEIVVAIARDISERKQAELQLQDLIQKLKASNAEKDKFFNIIAHDLRSPFNTILGFSSLLANKIENYDTAKIKKLADALHGTAKNTFALTENLLEWARAQRGKTPFEPTENNLQNTFTETVSLFTEQAQKKGVELKQIHNKELRFEYDNNMISTILRNLISNALKYTEQGDTVTIHAKTTAENVFIFVEDTGIGMNEKTQKTLFKMGESQSRPGTHGERGTGFGLMICKEFTEKHKGSITVESNPGEGSVFTVKLPLKQNNK